MGYGPLDLQKKIKQNKKSELMLIRHATASIQYRTQVVLVCIQYISAKILSVRHSLK